MAREVAPGIVVLDAYVVGGNWGWVARRLDGAPVRRQEEHDSKPRYATQMAAQEAGITFCERYWGQRPAVLRVNGATMKGRRVDTGRW